MQELAVECDYQAVTAGTLKNHIKVLHKKELADCSRCDFKTAYFGQLLFHFKAKHAQLLRP